MSGVTPAPVAWAQATIDRADPSPDATVTGAPDLVTLWFEQPLDLGPDAAVIEVVNDRGERQAMGPAAVYPADPRHVNASVRDPLPPGAYTVLWTVRLAGEDVSRSGAYGFKIAGSAIPGAATESDAFPAFWAVIARFLTLLGIALALGGYVLTPFATISDAAGAGRRRRSLTVVGAVLAVLGTLIEPVVDALLTVPSPALPALLATYPPAWWLRAGALLALAVVALLSLLSGSRTLDSLARAAGIVLGAVALMAVSVANVTAARAPSLPVAEALMIALQIALVLLAGIAAHLALVPVTGPATAPARLRSSLVNRWLVVTLAAAGVIVSAALSLVLLTGLADLVGRAFGWLLLAVALLLLGALVAGFFIRRGESTAPWSAATLAALALAAGAVLAIMVPPVKAADMASLAAVDVVTPVPVEVAGEPGLLHLLIQPAATGNNLLAVWLATASGAVPAPDARPDYRVELRSLSADTAPLIITPEPDEASPFTLGATSLPDAGWWQADVTVTPPAGEPATAAFYLLAPDPNVHGYGPEPTTSPEAEAVFDRGLATMTSLHQVRFTTTIGGGGGTFAQATIAVSDGSDGAPRAYHEQSATYETIIVGDQQWLRQRGEDWTERPAGYVFTPSEWGSTYEHATGFALGPTVEIDGEQVQVVTFHLPRQEHPRQEPAWFAWWVGTESGNVYRETMISTRHYMVYNFSGFNQPVEIAPPVSG